MPQPCSQTQMLSFSFTGTVTLGAPLALTLGAPNLDYSIVPGGSCTQGSTFVAGDTCTLQARFHPFCRESAVARWRLPIALVQFNRP
jgi:hypothetical protein